MRISLGMRASFWDESVAVKGGIGDVLVVWSDI